MLIHALAKSYAPLHMYITSQSTDIISTMHTTPPINYEIIADAISYYERHGFKYIDVPWYVGEDAINATKPADAPFLPLLDGHLIGSAEQGFIELWQRGELPNGRYCACSPCFRSEIIDKTHFTRFMKVELIDVGGDTYSDMVYIAERFFRSYLPAHWKNTPEGVDIFTESGVELGSYGAREYKGMKWMYGTGVAEPRLSQHIQTGGYHSAVIRRGKIGTIDKVLEEVREYIDAENQNNKIMGLVELSDAVGAIQKLLEKEHPSITLDDLKIMADATSRAFESGRRS